MSSSGSKRQGPASPSPFTGEPPAHSLSFHIGRGDRVELDFDPLALNVLIGLTESLVSTALPLRVIRLVRVELDAVRPAPLVPARLSVERAGRMALSPLRVLVADAGAD